MKVFSSLKVFIFLSVVLLFFVGVADVYAQKESLSVQQGFPVEATIGDAIEATFLAQIDGEPAVGVQLTIQYSGIADVTVSNGGVTDFLGTVTVTGTLVSLVDVFVEARWEWEDRHLSALAACPCRPFLEVYSRVDNSERFYVKYEGTFRHPDVQQFFPDVLRAFKNPEIQEVLNPSIINLFLRDPRLIRSLYPNVDDSILALLLLDEQFQALFRDEDFYAVLINPAEIEKLVELISQTTPNPRLVCPIPVPDPPKATMLSIVSGYGQEGLPGQRLVNPFVVEVRDQYGEAFSGAPVVFSVTGGGTVFPTTERTNGNGRASTMLTLGRSAGVNVVKASVTGIVQPQIFTATATAPPAELPVPTKLEIISGNNQTGESGMPLAQPFVVGVLDQNAKPLAGVDVTFSVIRGSGSFSDDKTTETVSTDAYGQASVTLTLGSNVGVNLVEAAIGPFGFIQNRPVTFSAVAKSDTLPVVYWIENDVIYKFTGDGKEPLVGSESGWTATSLTVAGNKIYWTEQQIGKQKGRIRTASLNGTNVKTLKMINAMPNGIVANPVTRRLYWTSSRGKIQSIGFNGKGFEGSFVTGLGMPKHIVLAEIGDVALGEIYWTAYEAANGWSIWSATLGGRIQPKELLTLGELGELKGLAVTGNKLYWAEKTAGGQGKIRSAYLNGSSVKTLHVLEGSIPSGIAVDAAGSSLYWTSSNGTNFSGSIQRLNLDEPIQIVATNLQNPTGIALGSMPAAAAPARPAPPSILSESSDQNALLANYPNPFNPETWIPYQLSEATDVTVSIYSVNGQLVRHLDLGHQSAGVYRSRSRAAYWDGRNAFGERVASGLYFYTLTAGDFTATRKMLIRK